MVSKSVGNYQKEDVTELFGSEVGAAIIVDSEADEYQAIIKRGIFDRFIKERGVYKELIEALWFHLNTSETKITENYQVFIPTFRKFNGKYSKRLKLLFEGDSNIHLVQMTVYPISDERYMFILDELDNSEYMQEFMTDRKVDTIQNTYLFSMYIDLVQNTTSSISITEISDDTINSIISYTDWRMMIVNMIGEDDKEEFLLRTDPDYLKKNFAPGKTSSFNCLMQNLEGKYIWVKLIFSRAQTTNDDDYRFVFMVQNIHENSVELFSELKKYEEMASKDSLTSVFNHGRMEIEISNAIDNIRKKDQIISCMMFDIDHFKDVNDTHGHVAGDDTLKCFSSIIYNYAKDNNSVVGRWGGEEFVLVCYDQDVQKAFELAETIRKKIENITIPIVGKITCSIGVTQMRKIDSVESAFCRMDKAMYKAKSEGRNCVRVITEECAG